MQIVHENLMAISEQQKKLEKILQLLFIFIEKLQGRNQVQ
jgi:hypothetical protein